MSDFAKARSSQAESQLIGIGLTANQRAAQTSRAQVVDRFQQIRSSFTARTMREGEGLEALNSTAYAEGMAAIGLGGEQQLADEDAQTQRRIGMQQDWTVGAKQAYGDL
ncbi:hypothetical protein G6F59_016650 [Rhizopus arrhizus]|nr:hypothetical protein G6F59_016650 [Rhizopus arrhizus]